MKKISKNVGMYIVLIVLVVSLVNVFLGPDSNQKSTQAKVMPYNVMRSEVNNGNVTKVRIDPEKLTGTLKSGGEFVTYIVDASSLPDFLSEKGVEVEVVPPPKNSWLTALLTSLLPTLLLIGVWISAHRRLDLLHLQHAGRRQQGHGLREEQGEAFPRQPSEGDLRRCRGLRRIEGRA